MSDVYEWLKRIAAEFREMPGLMLTPEQAARLWGLERSITELLLEDLREARVLTRTDNGLYRLT